MKVVFIQRFICFESSKFDRMNRLDQQYNCTAKAYIFEFHRMDELGDNVRRLIYARSQMPKIQIEEQNRL